MSNRNYMGVVRYPHMQDSLSYQQKAQLINQVLDKQDAKYYKVTTVNGSTSGSAAFVMPEQGVYRKKVIIYLTALNGTASYTFDTPFTYTPLILTTSGLAAAKVTALTTTACTVTGAPDTGMIILEGY